VIIKGMCVINLWYTGTGIERDSHRNILVRTVIASSHRNVDMNCA
jgi:hypothetical protein